MFKPEVKSQYNEDICLLVKLDNHPWNYLCECGDASDLSVREVQDSNAVFISHTHIDHFVNFDAVIRHQIGLQRRVVICGPKGLARQVQAKILSYTWNLIQEGAIVYEIRELISENEQLIFELEPPVWELKEIGKTNSNLIFEDKAFQVTAILLDHKIPTLAYKFKEQDTVKIDIAASGFKGGKWVKELKEAYENGQPETIIEIEGQQHKAESLFHLLHTQVGDSVGIIMDHAASPENHAKIIQHFSGCRQVFIECFYKNADQEFAEVNYHSYAAMSGKVMREAGIKEALPVHFSRKYKEEEVQEVIAEFETAYKQ